MKYYIQYYDLAYQFVDDAWKKTTIQNGGKLIEPCGDRAVIICDGRNSIETMKVDAIKNNGVRRPVYIAFRIFKGSFLDSVAVTDFIYL